MQAPKRALILLTSHRSGSTWLSDAIRCHPAVEYFPKSVVYELLGISGRRYPGDLSNKADGTYEIEVSPERWDKIPKFDISKDLDAELSNLKFDEYAIEKCHPSFFEFNPQIFVNGLARLENEGINIKLIYLVRDPKSLMASFLNYQSRKPSWYSDVTCDDLPRLIQRTYACIAQTIQRRPGIVLDYSDSRADLAYVLTTVYMYLWPNLDPLREENILQISELAKEYTNRKVRARKIRTPFLGAVEGKIRGSTIQYRDFFREQEALMQECYESYQQVIDDRSIRI